MPAKCKQVTRFMAEYLYLQSKSLSVYCQKIDEGMPLGEKVMGVAQVLKLQPIGRHAPPTVPLGISEPIW